MLGGVMKRLANSWETFCRSIISNKAEDDLRLYYFLCVLTLLFRLHHPHRFHLPIYHCSDHIQVEKVC